MKTQAAGPRVAVPHGRPTSVLGSSWHARWRSRRRSSSAVASSRPRRCSSPSRPLSRGIGGSSPGTSCSASSSQLCCSSPSGATRWRSTFRSASSSTGSPSRSSCSSGWPHFSSIRGSASAYAAGCTGRAHRRRVSRLGRRQLRTRAPLASAVLKSVTLFLSFIIVFYFICECRHRALPALSPSRSSSCAVCLSSRSLRSSSRGQDSTLRSCPHRRFPSCDSKARSRVRDSD